MELKELYDKLLAEGCNRFYIESIGGPQDDDVERLGMYDGEWQVRYFERGQRGEIFFSTPDKQEAIRYYYHHVMKMQHRHLVVFSRSHNTIAMYKNKLEDHFINTVEYTIQNYSAADDAVFGLIVINKDIFKARELFDTVPYIDEGLKR